MKKNKKTIALYLYYILVYTLGFIFPLIVNFRAKNNKEITNRTNERFGLSTAKFNNLPNNAKIIWIHGASVGESFSVLPLINYLISQKKNYYFVMTTQTVTSSKLIQKKIKDLKIEDKVIHQFVPFDYPKYIINFLDYWKFSCVIFLESEIWPNIIINIKKRKLPLLLLNARISPKSFKNWFRFKKSFSYLLSCFDEIIAQDKKNQERLSLITEGKITCLGNLKLTSPILDCDEKELSELKELTKNNELWVGASTHEGEEEVLLQAQKKIAIIQKSTNKTMDGEEIKPIKLIIVPRHQERGTEIAELCKNHKLTFAQRSKNEKFTEDTDIYIVDTLGELGIFYRLAKIAFIGGSIIKKGGHNPLEPARLNTTILHGPNFFNFSDIYENFRRNLASAQIRNSEDIVQAITRLLQDPLTAKSMADFANKLVTQNANDILQELSNLIIEKIENKNHEDA